MTMDVDTTLAALRQALMEHDFESCAGCDGTDACDLQDRLNQVLELFEALDGWLTKGGYLPQSWDLDSNV